MFYALTSYRFARVLALILACMSVSASAEPWSTAQDPSRFLFPDEQLEYRFDQLRLSASVQEGAGHMPSSDSYWPANRGGIAHRFFEYFDNAFTRKPLSLEELRAMTPNERRALSPSEKFDISQGDYTYKLTRRVLAATTPGDAYWAGLCHGWSMASVNYPEPQAVVMTNPDGIDIEFGSSDIKALLAFYSGYVTGPRNEKDQDNWGVKEGKAWSLDPEMEYARYRDIGTRCENANEGRRRVGRGILGRLFGRVDTNTECKGDINPGTLHLILANIVGRGHRSFVMDIDPSTEVWNQPVAGYTSQVIRERSGANGSRELLIYTRLNYVLGSDPTFGMQGSSFDTKYLYYTLELDREGRITGGRWKYAYFASGRRTEFIDWIWRTSRVSFQKEFAPLNYLYRPVATQVNSYAEKPGSTPTLQDVAFGL